MTSSDRHRLTYVDLHPEPLERPGREPSTLHLIAGAVVAALALYAALLFLFTL